MALPPLDLKQASRFVAVANTPLFLLRKLRSDAAIQDFARQADASEIFAELSQLMDTTPQTFEDVARIYALLIALALKPGKEFLPEASKLAFKYSEWFQYIGDYLAKEQPTTIITSINAPTTGKRAIFIGAPYTVTR